MVVTAAESTHESGDGDGEQDEAGAAECRHDDDPQQTSVGQVAEPDRLDPGPAFSRRRRTRRREERLVE